MKFLSLALLVFVTSAHADDSLSTKVHNQYTSLRAMGMGNAFTAVADDYSLMFYNPAGFAKKRYNEVQFSLVGAGVSPKTMTLMDELKKASETGTDSEKATKVSNVLDQYYGKSLGGTVQAAEIFWTRKNWGVAILPATVTIDMSFNRQLGPAIDLNVIGDTTIAYGYGTEWNKNLSWGFDAKYVHRVAVDQSVSAIELAADSNVLSSKRFKEGNSIDGDIGVLWSPSWFGSTKVKVETTKEVKTEAKVEIPAVETPASEIPADESRTPQAENNLVVSGDPTLATPPDAIAETPQKVEPKAETTKTVVAEEETEVIVDNLPLTFGMVVKNVLGGSFSKSNQINKDATEAPNKMYTTIDLGSQYEIAKFGNLTMRSMLDFKNLLHPDITTTKATHVGVEFDYYPNSWFKTQLRAGLNQMYYTAGATFLFGVLHIDAVTYGEEVGTSSTKIENRVYAAKVGFNF